MVQRMGSTSVRSVLSDASHTYTKLTRTRLQILLATGYPLPSTTYNMAQW